MTIERPSPQDYPPLYETYIRLIKGDVIEELEDQQISFYQFIKGIAPELENYKYAEDKWTIKEVLGHILEVERVMAYRALAISRGDQQPLPGMDENKYVANSNYQERSISDLAEEFNHLRRANIYLCRSFSSGMLGMKGVANNKEIAVSALVFILAGHLKHHENILKERYLLSNASS